LRALDAVVRAQSRIAAGCPAKADLCVSLLVTRRKVEETRCQEAARRRHQQMVGSVSWNPFYEAISGPK
jgi:hypothetical protein